jgi:hypothetical protein
VRFDLELQLLEGKLRVKDLAEALRAAMQTDLGVAPADDRYGCLQDVHWYSGYIGGRFQSYTIGNILSAQFYAASRCLCVRHWLLLRCSSICLEYSQHRTKRHDVAGVIERRRIQARSVASVKKKGIRALLPVTE